MNDEGLRGKERGRKEGESKEDESHGRGKEGKKIG